jgi:hypothetical protein
MPSVATSSCRNSGICQLAPCSHKVNRRILNTKAKGCHGWSRNSQADFPSLNLTRRRSTVGGAECHNKATLLDCPPSVKKGFFREEKQIMDCPNKIPVVCPDIGKYNNRSVIFYVETYGKRQTIEGGKFKVWMNPDCLSVILKVEQPLSGHTNFFHLDQAAVNSIRPHPTKEGVWEIQEPLSQLRSSQ